MTTSLLGKVLNRAPVDVGAGRRRSLFADDTRPRGGTTASLAAMGAQSTLFAIVDRIAQKVGSVEWRLYASPGPGIPSHREQPTEEDALQRHPALTVWNNPNPHYTRTEFVETTAQHFELVGEMPWVLGRSELAPNGPPTELWPVRPDRIRPTPHPRDFISGWVYGEGVDEVPLRLDQVLFTKRPNPMNPYRGIGPVGTLIMDLEGEAAAAEFNTMFFRNGAEPGGLIIADRSLSDAEFDQLVERWNQQHRGVSNAHRVAVLENMQWQERRWSARDMQFEQLRRFTREAFRQAWGFPKPLLGDVEDVNRANAEAAQVVFLSELIKPRLDRIRETLNKDFLPLFGPLATSRGRRLDFDYVDPTPPDRAEARLELQNKVRLLVELTKAGFQAEPAAEFLRLPGELVAGYDVPVYVQGEGGDGGEPEPV